MFSALHEPARGASPHAYRVWSSHPFRLLDTRLRFEAISAWLAFPQHLMAEQEKGIASPRATDPKT